MVLFGEEGSLHHDQPTTNPRPMLSIHTKPKYTTKSCLQALAGLVVLTVFSGGILIGTMAAVEGLANLFPPACVEYSTCSGGGSGSDGGDI